MSWNVLGNRFRVTTFGESHGPVVGVVIDGVPPRMRVDLLAVQAQLDRRKPGRGGVSSPRQEEDKLQVLAGLFDGMTTGAPVCIVLANRDARPEDYEPLKDLFRPGQADFTWDRKYGIRDWRGSGRASGRETAARVAAGAVARQLLEQRGITITGHVVECAGIRATVFDPAVIEANPVRCADAEAAARMVAAVEAAREDGDSVGGVVEVRAANVPVGWGDPVFGKLDAALAGALMGIGAVKGVEVGDGFALARVRGSQSNDAMGAEGFLTNHAGGILGGISMGTEIVVRAAVKPTPSIARPQQTVDDVGRPRTITVPGRHDACIAPRLVPVAEAMVAICLVDAWLSHRSLVGIPTQKAPGG
jgi:chorismate synthase